MRKPVVTLVAVAAGAFAAGAFAEDAAQEALKWIGALPSHRSVERFDMTLGVTTGQLPRRPERIEEDREVLHVPAHYGGLAHVTGDGAATVFWFRDADGALRNVVVRDAQSRAVKVVSPPSSRYEADVRDLRR
jgi:hypothetical protein